MLLYINNHKQKTVIFGKIIVYTEYCGLPPPPKGATYTGNQYI